MARQDSKKKSGAKASRNAGSSGSKKTVAKKKAAASKKKTAARADAPPRGSKKKAAARSESRPEKGKLVNRRELAEIYGVSLPTVTNWVRRGCPYVFAGTRGRDWQFNTAAVADWREQQAYANAIGSTVDWDLEEAKRRREAAEAALKEIELAKARGEIVEIEAVADIVGDDYSRVRARLLSLAPKSAPLVHKAESVAEIREILDDAVRDALAELSAVAEEFGEPDTQDEDEASSSAAEASGQ